MYPESYPVPRGSNPAAGGLERDGIAVIQVEQPTGPGGFERGTNSRQKAYSAGRSIVWSCPSR